MMKEFMTFNLKKGGMSHDREEIDKLAYTALEQFL
jgi:hypothetical protein